MCCSRCTARPRQRLGDPVLAWAEITADPEKRRRYQRARGKGGLVRASWAEAIEIAAAAHVHTIKTYGPDRCAGFSPIPAMSMVSHCVGTRFIQLIGGVMTSFYDWYADLPVASPQVFGDQTDVPESGDWWDATYLMMWGSNVPVTRTPDAHWMAEVRYRGTKVVTVSPDYADNTKFADEWMPAQAGTDAALAMAMGHVILTEYFVQRADAVLPRLRPHLHRPAVPRSVWIHAERGRGLRARQVPDRGRSRRRSTAGRGRLEDRAARRVERCSGRPQRLDGVPVRRVGRGPLEPRPRRVSPRRSPCADAGRRRAGRGAAAGFAEPDGSGSVLRRGVPARRVGGHLVTTVFDLMLAQYGVDRRPVCRACGRAGTTTRAPYTPAWQAEITSVPAEQCIRIAREFAANAEESKGRSMIIMGAGICQWFHGDATYRSILALLILTGCMGRNGGGWAHYVGQEKCRPITGWISLANALDWTRPPRTMIGTSYWYMHTDQWRNRRLLDRLAGLAVGPGPPGRECTRRTRSPSRRGSAGCRSTRSSTRTRSSSPRTRRRPWTRGRPPAPPHTSPSALRDGSLSAAIEDVDAPENWPRTLVLWRSNLMGTSAKGNEYFLKHLLGTHSNVMGSENPAAPAVRGGVAGGEPRRASSTCCSRPTSG